MGEVQRDPESGEGAMFGRRACTESSFHYWFGHVIETPRLETSMTPGRYFIKSGRQRKNGKQRYFHSRLAGSFVAWQTFNFHCLYSVQQFSICFVYDFFGESIGQQLAAPGGMWAGQLPKLMWQFSLVA